MEAVLGRRMARGRFEIAGRAPAYAARYRSAFHAPVRFEAPVTAMVIPEDWRQLRCPFADPCMFAAALSRLQVLDRRLGGLDHTAARVEQLMTVCVR